MLRKLIFVPLASLAAAFPSMAAVGDETSPAVLAASCVACHGTNGASTGAIPAISGHTEEDIQKSLTAFRDGSQKSTVMGRIAKGYTDAEIAALAKEVASWR